MGKWILLTGGAGYIGTHIALELLEQGDNVVVVDNFSTTSLRNIKVLVGMFPSSLSVETSSLSEDVLDNIFEKYPITTVIHLAGYKSVGESVKDPLKYYDNNISSSVSLLKSMLKNNVNNLVFSSSAAVYGVPEYVPIDEKHSLNPTSPYGKSKLFIEEIIRDVVNTNESFRCISLRYFNPVGTSSSGILHENPKGRPENLMPYLSGVVHGTYSHLNIYGTDYDTKDGSCVRDFVHVTDIAKGHVCSLELFYTSKSDDDVKDFGDRFKVYNLGSSVPHTVLDIVKVMQKVSGKNIPMSFSERRNGDVPVCWADTTKAFDDMGWKAECDVEDMCRTSLY